MNSLLESKDKSMKLKLIKRFSYKVPKYIYLKTYNQTNLITDFNIIDDYYIFQSNYNIDVYSEYKNNNYYDIIKKFVVPHLVLIISFIASMGNRSSCMCLKD